MADIDIERIAKAIHAVFRPDAEWETEYAHWNTVCRQAARAAVLAMPGVKLTYENLEGGFREGWDEEDQR